MLKQLSGLDSTFLYLDNTRTPLEVSSLQIYDPSTAPGGKVRFDDILATFENRLDRSKVFRRKLCEVPLSLDHPYWIEDEDFDIEYHVRHLSLPKPGDWRQLMIQVSRLQSQHLDKTRPLWEVYVIEGLDRVQGLPKGCFAVFMKMHHATIDGVSGQEIQVAIHDLEPLLAESGGKEGHKLRKSQKAPEPWTLVAKSTLNNTLKSARLVAGVASAASGLIRAGLASRGKEKTVVPRTLFNVGRATANRVIDGRFFALAEVKDISRHIPDTTVNDVILTVVSGALRRYLQTKSRLPDESLVAACPVNARGSDGKDSGHANMVTMMNASLHSNIADPIERMHAIHKATREAKELTRKMGAGTLTEIPMNLPAPIAKNLFPPLMELVARSGSISFNTIITNVPGIQQPIYLAGAEMVKMMGMGPVVDQSGVFHAAFSYNGAISITFTACREMMTDPAFYADCIQASYDELKQMALGVKTAAPKKTTRRKTDPKKLPRKKLPVKLRKKAMPEKQVTRKKTTKKKIFRKKKIMRKKPMKKKIAKRKTALV